MLKFLRSFFDTAITDFDDRGRVVELRRSSEGAVLEHPPASTDETEQHNGDQTKPTLDKNALAKDQAERKKPRTVKERLTKGGQIVLSLLLSIGICAGFFYFIWTLSLIASASLAIPRWIAFVITLFLIWFVPKLWRHSLGKIKPSQDPYQIMILVEYVRNSICPGCFYRLDESLTEADGCTVCPECGAAWNLPFWKREHQLPKLPANNAESALAKKLFLIDARGFSVQFLGNRTLQERVERVKAYKKGASPELNLFDLALGLLAFCATAFGIIWYLRRVNLDYMNYIPHLLTASAVAGVVFPLVVVLLFRRSAVQRSKAVKIASEMVASSVCPCCEAKLGNELTWRDGLRLCQACYAAWLPDGKVEPWNSKHRWNVNIQKNSQATGPSTATQATSSNP